MRNKNKGISNKFPLLGLLLFTCLICGNATASLTQFNPGYGRLIMDKVAIVNSGTSFGAARALAFVNGITLSQNNTSLFTFYSAGKLKWKETPTSKTIKTRKSSAFMWAEIDPTTNTVVNGRIDIFGKILGFNGLQFGADLSSNLIWQEDKIGFAQTNHEGNVCDLGFCSFVEELLMIKDISFNGDFSRAFLKKGKVISTVPIPAAAWLFISGIIGLFGYNRKRA
jgi:hypothetical protein